MEVLVATNGQQDACGLKVCRCGFLKTYRINEQLKAAEIKYLRLLNIL